jgi:hypothetical protein
MPTKLNAITRNIRKKMNCSRKKCAKERSAWRRSLKVYREEATLKCGNACDILDVCLEKGSAKCPSGPCERSHKCSHKIYLQKKYKEVQDKYLQCVKEKC